MSHGLDTTRSGKVRMAYADSEVPWHLLGTPMKGLQTADEMLRAAEADYTVLLTKVAALDEYGQVIWVKNAEGEMVPLQVDDSRATVRVNSDGTVDALSTVGTRYVVQQNKDCLNRALAIVGASAGDAVVDTCGVLGGGREFFASIDLGALVIDPAGVNDAIERYLLVRNGHDGKTPITYANTSIRAVCKNTVNAGMRKALRVFTARHTRNQDIAIEEAREVLNFSTAWAEEFSRTAELMMSVSMTAGSGRIDKVLDSVFPKSKDETDVKRRNREDIIETVRTIYASDKNVGKVGSNGWAIYNSVVEYLDHYRDAKPVDRAALSMDPNSWVSRKKQEAQEAVLALI